MAASLSHPGGHKGMSVSSLPFSQIHVPQSEPRQGRGWNESRPFSLCAQRAFAEVKGLLS